MVTSALQLAEGLDVLQKGDVVTIRGQWRGLDEATVRAHAGVMWAAASRFADSSGFQTTPTVERLGAGPFLLSLGQDLAPGDYTSAVRIRMQRQATAREVRQVINEYVLGDRAVSARSLILANQSNIIDPRTAPRSPSATQLTITGIEQDPGGFARETWQAFRGQLEEIGSGLGAALRPLVIPIVLVGAVILLLQDELRAELKKLKGGK